MVSSVTATMVNGEIANGVEVVVAAGAVSAGGAFDAAAADSVTKVRLLVESSPQPLIITTAAHVATRVQARRSITSS